MKTKKVPKTKKAQTIVKISPPPDRPWMLSQEEITLVKNSIAKGASDEELGYCLTVARRYKLDPFKQQIWFVKRWDKSADNGKGGKGTNVWTPQVGINGLLFAAARDHKHDFGSVSLPEYGPMVKNSSGNMSPEWARVKVWKKGESEPTEAQAWWDEYAPFDLSTAPFWRKMPRRMIGKCATALAIRQAYPDLGGLQISEECERMGEDYSPGGRLIEEIGGTVEAAQAVAKKKIEAHKEGKVIDVVPETEQEWETISVTPWKDGRVSLIGPGLNVVRPDMSPELIAELDIKHNAKENITHMPASKVFEFIDRAAKSKVKAALSEPGPEQGTLL